MRSKVAAQLNKDIEHVNFRLLVIFLSLTLVSLVLVLARNGCSIALPNDFTFRFTNLRTLFRSG